MTIRELAAATGISAASIGKIENDVREAKLESIRKLSYILGVPIYYLGCFEKLPEKTIGQKIAKARLYHGLTKEEMAARLEVDVKTLRNWEQGRYLPSAQHRSALDDFLAILSIDD